MSEYRRHLAYTAGKKAGLSGQPKTENNRERGTIFFDDWCDGWSDGERQRSSLSDSDGTRSAETACPAPVPKDCQARAEGIAKKRSPIVR